LAALKFAAHKHSRQRRKDLEATPYINHPIEVAEVLSRIGGITDLPTLQAAILHDIIEDTETSPQELEDYFGQEVRLLVQEVTDKSLPKQERKRLQVEHAPNLSTPAKLIKLGDKNRPPVKCSVTLLFAVSLSTRTKSARGILMGDVTGLFRFARDFFPTGKLGLNPNNRWKLGFCEH
jgi:hypothetical protein